MKPKDVCQICFALVILIGIGCLVLGPGLDSTHPHLKLDVVLTPEELKDKGTRDRTLDILKRGSRTDAPYWWLVGLALIVVGSGGVYAARSTPRTKAVS